MSEPAGIVYRTRGLIRWLSLYPNVRLIVVGVLLYLIGPILIGSAANVVDRMFRPPHERWLTAPPFEHHTFVSMVISVAAAIVVAYGAFILIGFAVLRMAWNLIRKQFRVNLPAPNPDDASGSTGPATP